MKRRQSIVGDYGNGIHVEYLPANQAYLVMWYTQRLRGPIDAETTIHYLWNTLGIKVS